MAQQVLLEVSGLRAGYGRVPVLHGIDLEVREGEVIGVLGHNGMGKSTLMKTLMGFIRADAGRVVFDGADVTTMPPNRRNRLGLGYVPQGRGIFPQLSVLDNLRMGCVQRDVDEGDALDDVLGEFPRLERLLDRPGGALSGGEQQLLALARCLASGPRLLLLDEPTEGIQPSIIDEIEETLLRLRDSRGLTVILVEQNLEFITTLSDRVLLLQRGRIAGEVAGSNVTDPSLIDEFVGLGGGTAKPAAARTTTAAAATTTTEKTPTAAAQAPRLSERTFFMTVKRPTLDQMRDIVRDFGMSMNDDAILQFMTLMEGTIAAYDVVDGLPDYLPEVDYPRTPGQRVPPEDNPLNAWYVKSEVRGARRGPLSGRTIVLKDNVCLAGVPMMNGASTLDGYVPDVDATIVTRILDAGGTVVGKAHCEYFCLSGGSHTNATGPVHNPYKLGYAAGGSSSGSGALVGGGEVDMAIGGDQGGSIRIPASFCGCYGMKATHGLVPYTGVMPIEATIDHCGPMTQNVADNAVFLEVLAGEDGLDPRQYAPKVDNYTAALGKGVRGLRIGVVTEGFGHENSEPDVDEKNRKAAALFSELGAEVDEISIPMHAMGASIWTPIALEGLTNQMMLGNGFGTSWKGLYVTSLLDHHANWPARSDELSDSLKISMMIGQYFLKHYRGHFYAKAQNLNRQLRKVYDDQFATYDLLLMPTTPMKATPIPAPDAPLDLYIQRAFEMIANTSPFDITGHPAMSIPCGMSEGLPVGLMLVGRQYAEATIYQAAHAFEQAGDWHDM